MPGDKVYELYIDALTPMTISMGRLAEYLADFAELLRHLFPAVCDLPDECIDARSGALESWGRIGAEGKAHLGSAGSCGSAELIRWRQASRGKPRISGCGPFSATRTKGGIIAATYGAV